MLWAMYALKKFGKGLSVNAFLKYYCLQAIKDEEPDEIIFGHFEYLAEQYEKQKANMPEGNLVEISYEG